MIDRGLGQCEGSSDILQDPGLFLEVRRGAELGGGLLGMAQMPLGLREPIPGICHRTFTHP